MLNRDSTSSGLVSVAQNHPTCGKYILPLIYTVAKRRSLYGVALRECPQLPPTIDGRWTNQGLSRAKRRRLSCRVTSSRPEQSIRELRKSNIRNTIYRRGYTKSVRHRFQYTNAMKHRLMRIYGARGSIHDYELDHLIPLYSAGTSSLYIWIHSGMAVDNGPLS